MPGINGIETARRMSEIAPAVPIVLFTQHASTDLEKHAEGGRHSICGIQNERIPDGGDDSGAARANRFGLCHCERD